MRCPLAVLRIVLCLGMVVGPAVGAVHDAELAASAHYCASCHGRSHPSPAMQLCGTSAPVIARALRRYAGDERYAMGRLLGVLSARRLDVLVRDAAVLFRDNGPLCGASEE